MGYHLGLAEIAAGERVVDLGSGSGMDAFLAAQHAGTVGEVIGIDMTDEQLTKARRLAERDSFTSVRFEKGCIEETPIVDESVDVLISNGVINLCDDKTAAFREIARMLKQFRGHERARHARIALVGTGDPSDAPSHSGDRLGSSGSRFRQPFPPFKRPLPEAPQRWSGSG